jgi:hypothetical protein
MEVALEKPRVDIGVGPASAGLALGCMGLLMLGLQPLILGGLLEEKAISISQLGEAATAEQLMLGGVAGLLGTFARRTHLRLYGVSACMVLALANAGCIQARGREILVYRLLCGTAGGVLVWIAGAVVAFSPSPAKYSALYVGSQAASQFVVASALPLTLMPLMGARGGFLALAILSMACATFGMCVPSSIYNVEHNASPKGRIQLTSMFGLSAAFLFMSGLVGFWVFVEPLANVNHASTFVKHYAVSMNLACQILAAALCTLYAPRIARNSLGTVITSAVAFSLLLCVVALRLGSGAFLSVAALHGALWVVGLSAFTPMMIYLDPTRRGAILLHGALLIGGSFGPLIIGWFSTEDNLMPVLLLSGIYSAGCLACTVLAETQRRRRH